MSGEVWLPEPDSVWAITQEAISARGARTTVAAQNEIADQIDNLFLAAAASPGAPALCRLRGNIVAGRDPTAVVVDLANPTLLRDAGGLATRLGPFSGYQFTDYDGAQITKTLPAIDVNTMTVGQLFVELTRYMHQSVMRTKASVTESHNTEISDDFDTDPTSRWTARLGTFAWDSTNNEVDPSNANDYVFEYTNGDPGSIEHECMGLGILNGSNNTGWMGPVHCRLNNSATQGYQFQQEPRGGGNGIVFVFRYDTGLPTELAQWSRDLDINNWLWSRLACSGGVGASVVCDGWFSMVGTTKPSSDLGWFGDDASPDFTVTDANAARHDDSDDDRVGMGGYMNAAGDDPRHDWWRARAISDRGAGGIIPLLDQRQNTLLRM